MITGSKLDPKIYLINKMRNLFYVGSIYRPYIYYKFKINFDENYILLYSKIGNFIYSLSDLNIKDIMYFDFYEYNLFS